MEGNHMNANHAIVCIALCLSLFGCVTTSQKASMTPVKPVLDGAVAVWELEDVTTMGASQPELSEFLSARVLETVKGEGAKVVEREKLLAVIQEISLGAGKLSDAETKLSIGRLAGAKHMIFGGYQVVGGSMRIDLRMVEVETGRIMKASEQTIEGNKLTDWLGAAEAAAKKLFQ